MPAPRDIQIAPDSGALADRAAALIVQAAQEAVAARGRFTLALTGGSGPQETYKRLAKAPLLGQIDWGRTFVFLGDDRFVPYNDERSNYGMCRRLLLSCRQ